MEKYMKQPKKEGSKRNFKRNSKNALLYLRSMNLPHPEGEAG
jgi:hypothetical protein